MFDQLDATTIWIVSNGAGAIAFAALTVFILRVGRDLRLRRLLAVACAINALWCALLALAPVAVFGAPLLDCAESVRSAAWLVLAAMLYGQVADRALGRWVQLAAWVGPLFLIGFLSWRFAASYTFGSVTANHSIALIYGSTLMALFGLALIEQVLRGVDADARWAMKYLCLGIGTLFAYDFVMYASALVTYRISLAEADARGLINAFAAPLIAISVMRQSMWSSRTRLSRQAVFRTTAIVLGGGYLLFIAVGRYIIRNLGGTWSQVFAVTFVAVTAVGLAVLIFSGQVRAHIRVLLNKHFFRYKYDYREEWLALTDRLTQAGDGLDPYQRAVRAIAQMLDCPSGALWLKREPGYVSVSNWNLRAAEDTVLSADSDVAEFLGRSGWVLDLAPAGGASDVDAQGLTLPEWFPTLPNAWLILPLLTHDGLLGFVVFASPRAPYRLTWEDFDLLKMVGRQVGVYLQQQENSQALAQARQFETFNRLTAFLMHDLKNIASQQSLMLQNAHKYKRDPQFVDDMIATIDESVARINNLLAQIQRRSEATGNVERIAVEEVLAEVGAQLAKRRPAPVIDAKTSGAFVRADRDKLVAVLQNIVRNAQDATPADGSVTVCAQQAERQVQIDVSDTGTGMTPAFVRDALFKPFYTTKSTQGMGIGAYEARDFARGAGGDVDVTSEPGRGTTFSIRLPLMRQHAPEVVANAVDNERQTENKTEVAT